MMNKLEFIMLNDDFDVFNFIDSYLPNQFDTSDLGSLNGNLKNKVHIILGCLRELVGGNKVELPYSRVYITSYDKNSFYEVSILLKPRKYDTFEYDYRIILEIKPDGSYNKNELSDMLYDMVMYLSNLAISRYNSKMFTSALEILYPYSKYKLKFIESKEDSKRDIYTISEDSVVLRVDNEKLTSNPDCLRLLELAELKREELNSRNKYIEDNMERIDKRLSQEDVPFQEIHELQTEKNELLSYISATNKIKSGELLIAPLMTDIQLLNSLASLLDAPVSIVDLLSCYRSYIHGVLVSGLSSTSFRNVKSYLKRSFSSSYDFLDGTNSVGSTMVLEEIDGETVATLYKRFDKGGLLYKLLPKFSILTKLFVE